MDDLVIARSRRWVARCTVALGVLAVVSGGTLLAGSEHLVTPQVVSTIMAGPQMPVAGAVDADVTVVEFLDYNCPYCKKSAPELQKLLRSDQRVRVVFKEWPIFGDVSEYAARSALAAKWQGKSLAAHEALISAPAELQNRSQVDSLLERIGVNMERLSADGEKHLSEIDAILARNAAEARALGLKGTPGFLVGSQLVHTALTLSQLQELTAKARSSQLIDRETAIKP